MPLFCNGHHDDSAVILKTDIENLRKKIGEVDGKVEQLNRLFRYPKTVFGVLLLFVGGSVIGLWKWTTAAIDRAVLAQIETTQRFTDAVAAANRGDWGMALRDFYDTWNELEEKRLGSARMEMKRNVAGALIWTLGNYEERGPSGWYGESEWHALRKDPVFIRMVSGDATWQKDPSTQPNLALAVVKYERGEVIVHEARQRLRAAWNHSTDADDTGGARRSPRQAWIAYFRGMVELVDGQVPAARQFLIEASRRDPVQFPLAELKKPDGFFSNDVIAFWSDAAARRGRRISWSGCARYRRCCLHRVNAENGKESPDLLISGRQGRPRHEQPTRRV